MSEHEYPNYVRQKTLDIVSLILGERDKKTYFADLVKDKPFFDIVETLLAYEKLNPLCFYHIQDLGVATDGKNQCYVLWNRIDWDLDVEKQRAQKAGAEKRLVEYANDTELMSILCKGVAEQFGCEVGAAIVVSTASIVRQTKNRLMAAEYGVSEELMNKVWGEKK